MASIEPHHKQIFQNGRFPPRLEGIRDRLRLLISSETENEGRFSWLDRRSGIPRKTWQTWWTRNAMPNAQMIEAAGRLWPSYAFWLCTGLVDQDCGHGLPDESGAKSYPEPSIDAIESKRTTAEFQQCMAMQHQNYGDEPMPSEDDFNRLKHLRQLRQKEIELTLRRKLLLDIDLKT